MESNSTNTGSETKSYVIAPEKPALKIALSVISSIIAALVGYYLYLPAINPKSIELWIYLSGVVLSFIFFLSIFSGATKRPEYGPYVRKKSIVPLIIVGALVLTVGIGYLVGAPIFRAKDYSQLLNFNNQVETDFVRDVQELDAANFSRIPRLDEESARQLSNKALSDLGDSDTVSQYTAYPMYTQINYKEKPVRVVPLQYASIIKWFTNTSRGLPGYIIIDMANEDTQFHKLSEDQYIRYSPAEHFGRLLKRHLRFEYPTYLFGDATFEVDDEGNPYWITPRLNNKLGLFGGKDVIGAVITSADSETGKNEYYTIEQLREREDLQWVDRVFDSLLLVNQFNYAGKYQSGFWNSILGQRDVRMATDGYSYIAKDDDVFLYTGVTSATSDQSIIGFLLINQRTKAADFYRVGGATETSAMGSAEGIVADKGYKATFPLLINVSGQPTYFMALKDIKNNNQIVQQFALVNVKDFNKIRASATTVNETFKLYLNSLSENGIKTSTADNTTPGDSSIISGTVTDIRSQLMDGTSVYYIKLNENKSVWYRISALTYEPIVLINKGAKIKILPDTAEEGATIIDILEFK